LSERVRPQAFRTLLLSLALSIRERDGFIAAYVGQSIVEFVGHLASLSDDLAVILQRNKRITINLAPVWGAHFLNGHWETSARKQCGKDSLLSLLFDGHHNLAHLFRDRFTAARPYRPIDLFEVSESGLHVVVMMPRLDKIPV
jgi:hypothetical protein